jgi:anti-sigma B factor antagonist
MDEYRFFLWGEADLASAPKILAALDQAIAISAAECFVVDCTALTFIDSTGIRALIEGSEALQRQGRSMQVVNLKPGPRRVFDILGLLELFKVDGLIAS